MKVLNDDVNFFSIVSFFNEVESFSLFFKILFILHAEKLQVPNGHC